MENETEVETEVSTDIEPEGEQRSRPPAGTFRVTERDQGGSEARTLFGKYQAAGWTPGGAAPRSHGRTSRRRRSRGRWPGGRRRSTRSTSGSAPRQRTAM